MKQENPIEKLAPIERLCQMKEIEIGSDEFKKLRLESRAVFVLSDLLSYVEATSGFDEYPYIKEGYEVVNEYLNEYLEKPVSANEPTHAE